jgi:hypothetical protein
MNVSLQISRESGLTMTNTSWGRYSKNAFALDLLLQIFLKRLSLEY